MRGKDEEAQRTSTVVKCNVMVDIHCHTFVKTHRVYNIKIVNSLTMDFR